MPAVPSRRPRALAGAVVVVLLWLVVGGVVGPLSGKLAEVQKNDNASFLPGNAESTEVLEIEKRFRSAETIPAIVVYERASGITEADRARAAADAQRLASTPGAVGRPSPPIPSEDGKALQVVVPLDGTDGDAIITSVEAMRESVRSADGLDVYVAGIAGLNADLFVAFEGIDTTLLLATATVVIVILLLVYRSPVLWLLPLLSAGLAYAAAAGIIYVLAKNDVLTLNGQSQGILTVLVFGAGTDYALLLIARYREELHRFESKYDAMRAALRSAFPAIAASAATVIAGLLCLLVSELNSNRGLGPVSAIGIAAAFVTMTTLLPALLVLCGRRVFWPRVPRHDELSPTETGVWAGVARGVGARPRRVWVATSLVLVALAAGMTQLRSDGIATTESFTNDVESVAGQEVLARHFAAGSGSPAVVVGSASAAGPLLASVRNAPGVADAAFLTDESGPPRPDAPPKTVDGRVIVQATLAAPPDSPQAQETVRSLREVVRGVAGADALVGGFTALDADVQAASQRDRVIIIPLVLLVILVILGLLLRAVVAPLVLVGTVVLSFAATLGVCGLVFRHVFGFAGEDSSFPLFAFVFLVALGIDYNIFLMTRVREESLRHGTRAGTLRGLAVTGGVITSAGVVLAATFSVLGVLPLVFLAELGFAVAFGVLLDTFVVRSLLVPALTLELDRRIWWPSRLARGEDEREPDPEPALVG